MAFRRQEGGRGTWEVRGSRCTWITRQTPSNPSESGFSHIPRPTSAFLTDGGNNNSQYSVETGVHAIHVRIPAFQQRSLPALPHPSARLLTVARVQAVDDIHPFDHRA